MEMKIEGGYILGTVSLYVCPPCTSRIYAFTLDAKMEKP